MVLMFGVSLPLGRKKKKNKKQKTCSALPWIPTGVPYCGLHVQTHTKNKYLQKFQVRFNNRPFALRGHVTSFCENESYMIFSSKND